MTRPICATCHLLPCTIDAETGEMLTRCWYCHEDLRGHCDGYKARKQAREDLEDRRDDEYARRMGRL